MNILLKVKKKITITKIKEYPGPYSELPGEVPLELGEKSAPRFTGSGTQARRPRFGGQILTKSQQQQQQPGQGCDGEQQQQVAGCEVYRKHLLED